MRTLIALLVAMVAATGCGRGGGGTAPSADTDAITVVATTTIVADLIRAVGAPEIEVVSLMGAGVDPHLYKPSAGDVRRMGTAAAVFYNGLHLEGKMSEVLGEMGRRGVRSVAVGDCVATDRLLPVPGFEDVHDPHIWFDVGLWSETARCVAEALGEIDPDRGSLYLRRASDYISSLGELEAWVGQRVAEIPADGRVLITAHDAFAYFGRAYGFEVRGLLGVSTAAEAGTADLQELAELIASRRIPAIFVESSVPSRFVEALQEAVAARGFEVRIGGTLYSDALGDPGTAEATYVGTVRTNVGTIVAALTGEVGNGEAR
jgi:manganese/zinc/iron transport system substrate-binding protein